MYLKEAFQYQNLLGNMIGRGRAFLTLNSFTMKTVQNHLRSKANPEAEDETIDLTTERKIDCSANDMISFVEHLLKSKQELTEAISKAKKSCEIDIDAEISNNRTRRQIALLMKEMSQLRSNERTTRGYAYKFNAEGNQVQYAYDVKEVTTIDFDRNNVKALSRRLSKEADEVSAKIDKLMVELEVEYEPEFSMCDSFEDAIEQFLGK